MVSSTETTTTKNMVRLTSSDGEWFDVRAEAIGAASVTIRGMLEDGCCSGDAIPVPNVTGRILARVLEYVNRHFDDRRYDPLEYAPDSPLKRFDGEFTNVGDDDVLFDIILDLLDLGCKAVAEVMRGKSPEELLRKRFNIRNDYTQEEGGGGPQGELMGLGMNRPPQMLS